MRQNQDLPLYDVPGDTLSILVGARFWERRAEAGIRYRDVASRTVVTGFQTGNRLILGTQPGYTLWDAYVAVLPLPNVELRASVENAFNETYYLNDGFGGGIGSQAPGRTFRLSAAVSF
jgi:hemoglobin/transferrin/lactoferrin receptor protein